MTDQPFVVLGAPWDGATTFRSGTRMGPGAIRDASRMLTDGTHEQWEVCLQDHVGDAGDVDLSTGNTDLMLKELAFAHRLFNSRHIVTLGGDHLVSLAVLRSLRTTRGPVSLVHFDAHYDTWASHGREPRGHGTWLRNAIDEGLVNPETSISIGLRCPADSEVRTYLPNAGGTNVLAREAMSCSPSEMACTIQSKVGEGPCYLSLDIDCLDPCHAPGTGTPEIGGLSSLWLTSVLDHLSDVNWCGMDLVEVCPPYDHSEITALAGATFVWQYLSMAIFQSLQKKGQ